LERAVVERPATYLRAELTRLPFPDATFDATISLQTLQYLIDPRAALRELARVMKQGATLVAALPNSAAPKYSRRGLPPDQLSSFAMPALNPILDLLFYIRDARTRGLWIPFPLLDINLALPVPSGRGIALTVVAARGPLPTPHAAAMS
jgi:SAM-dependent methyltransferase